MDTRLALRDARGPLNDLMDKLSGEQGAAWLRRLSKMLRGENPFEFHARDFAVWKILKLGTYKTVEEFTAALQTKKRRISDWAADILKKVTVASAETELDLVLVSVAELGFKDGATYKDICDRALECGLEFCPAEVGPQLRLQYEDQPKDEWVLIAMKAIRGSDGSLNIFDVVHDGDELWLCSCHGSPDYFWRWFNRLVFVRPRK